MDIVEEVKSLNKFSTIICTNGMTENELNAYNLGVETTLAVLGCVLRTDEKMSVVNIEGFDIPIELTVDELQEYCLTN